MHTCSDRCRLLIVCLFGVCLPQVERICWHHQYSSCITPPPALWHHSGGTDTDCGLQRNLRIVLHINFIFREMILVALYVQHYRSASVFSWSHCCHQNVLTDNCCCCNLHQKSSWMFRECLSERGNHQQVPVSVFFLFVGLLFPWDSHLIWDQLIASSALCWWVEQQILERTDAAFMKSLTETLQVKQKYLWVS